MVIGWQNVLYSVNSTVLSFNREYLESQRTEGGNAHYGMKEIAIKKLVIASLREIEPQLERWYQQLSKRRVLSPDTLEEKKRTRHVVKQVKKFKGVRNLAFHYGDPNEETANLIKLYKQIDVTDINLLNRILRDLVSLGEKLKEDALAVCD